MLKLLLLHRFINFQKIFSVFQVKILDNFDSKKHSGVIAYFRQQYVKTGKLDVSLSKIIDVLQTRREDSDYNIIVQFDSGDAYDAFEKATTFVSAIEEYLKAE